MSHCGHLAGENGQLRICEDTLWKICSLMTVAYEALISEQDECQLMSRVPGNVGYARGGYSHVIWPILDKPREIRKYVFGACSNNK